MKTNWKSGLGPGVSGVRAGGCGRGLTAAAIAAFAGSAALAGGMNILWEGGSEGDFNDPVNWANFNVPMLGDTAVFNEESVVFLDLDQDRSIARLLHTVGDLTLRLNTHTLQLVQPGSASPSLTTGSPAGEGTTLRVENGRLICEWASLADSISQFSEIVLGSPDADFESEISTWVGAFGTGVLRVVNGGFAGVGEDLIVGRTVFADGILVVEDEGSLVDVVDQLQVGADGDASAFVRKGGELSCRDAFVGAFLGSDGLLQVEDEGSEFEALGAVGIGFDGVGSVVITDGGVARCVQSRIGFSDTSRGSLLVRNPGSLFEVTGEMIIGNSGEGEMSVLNGGVATFGELSVDSSISPTGVVVSGAGARVSVADELRFGGVLGPEVVRFRVDSGATLEAGLIGVGEFGLLDVTNGTVSAGVLEIGDQGLAPGSRSAAGAARGFAGPTGFIGNGVIGADVSNGSGGVIRPRPDFVELGVSGSFRQLPGGTLELTATLPFAGGGTFSSLAVTGPAELGGTLRVIEVTTASSPLGARFPIITAGSIGGRFEDAELPEITSSRRYILVYGADRVELVSTVFGDTDGDLDVDTLDLGSLLAAWGSSRPNEDFNNDGVVGTEDLGILLSRWGVTAPR